MKRTLLALSVVSFSLAATHAGAEPIAGVCPDGSAFIVQKKADTPCKRAKFLDDPSDMPPLRPDLLPRPYTWTLDQKARDPNNPYNLVDAAEKMRAAREAQERAEASAPAPVQANATLPGVGSAPADGGAAAPLRLGLTQDEIGDLVRLVALRQELAPATFHIEDRRRNEMLVVRLAWSEAFETQVLDALGTDGKRVLLFSARAIQDAEFYTNFFFVEGGATFRPDPQDPHEVGWLVGDPGEIESGRMALGYVVVPRRFDPGNPLEVWWNDRSLHVVLAP